MVTTTIIASSVGVTDTLSISMTTLGYGLIGIGLIATLLSSHRSLLLYLFGGMAYWLVVEGIQAVISKMVLIDTWHSYVLALSLTWLLPGIFLAYRYIKTPSTVAAGVNRHGNQARHTGNGTVNSTAVNSTATNSTAADNYIEHTPVYSNYKPRFR